MSLQIGSRLTLDVIRGVSHLATSSEMQNYLKIAQSTIAVVDASLEVTIFDAMQSLAPEYRPKHVLFIGGTDLSRQVCLSGILT